jgi:c-di-GMP phosphodiesterase
VSGALVAASLLGFVASGHFAATSLIDAHAWKELRLLNQLALRGSEGLASFGATTLAELAAAGKVGCDAATLQAIRLHVYQRGAVKDIRIVDRHGSVLCSAYSETLEFDKEWVTRDQMLPAQDPSVRIFRVEQFFGTALGVLKDVAGDRSLVAILGFNGNQLDIMPAELRGHSEATLALSDGRAIAQSSQIAGNRIPDAAVATTMGSELYPVTATIRIDAAAFRHWNAEPYVPIVFLAALLGLAFGLLLSRVVARADNPVVELDRALAAGAFRPHLQPIFDLRTRAIVGCEALARWVRADGTVLPPAQFIQLAENSGRIAPMTWQILASALDGLRPVLRSNKGFRLSLNVVARHLVSPEFTDDLRRIVGAARISPRQIVLEITERQQVEDLTRAAEAIRRLREHGFKVAIDDVGIGHSGLSQIQTLGADILKIDKFFIDSICRDATAAAVIEMLVRLARELGMGIVAEGIETEEQIAALLACGVPQGQGYVVSPPLSVANFVVFLERITAAPEHEQASARAQAARVA